MAVTTSPAGLAFGSVPVGSVSAPQVVRVTNTGPGSATFTVNTNGSPGAKNFPITVVGVGYNPNSFVLGPFTLVNVNDYKDFNVYFAPKLPKGAKLDSFFAKAAPPSSFPPVATALSGTAT